MKTPLQKAILDGLKHLNHSRGRGHILAWHLSAAGNGLASRGCTPARKPDSFRFRVHFRENPERVTVAALGSTRTETVIYSA